MRPARRARRMHSPAAVALIPRAAAILRLDMPAADSLSRSRILRMGNLGPGIGALLLWKGAKPMLIRGLPNGARHTHPQVVAIIRNGWSRSIVAPGRDRSVRASFSQLSLSARCSLNPGGRNEVAWPLWLWLSQS